MPTYKFNPHNRARKNMGISYNETRWASACNNRVYSYYKSKSRKFIFPEDFAKTHLTAKLASMGQN